MKRTIRASEIGTYLYCRRAWWYQQKNTPPDNLVEMAEGTEFHYQHGRQVFSLGCMRVIAFSLLLISLALAVVFLVRLYIN